MKKAVRLVLIFITMLTIICVCDSCRHRSYHSRGKSRTEHRHSRSSDSQKDSQVVDMQEDYIAEVAEGDDYDEMLKCLKNGIKEIKKLKNDYFAGKLKDKEVKSLIDSIQKKYNPVMESLIAADNAGELNYNQHKKQMELVAEMMKLFTEIVNRLGEDFDNAF